MWRRHRHAWHLQGYAIWHVHGRMLLHDVKRRCTNLNEGVICVRNESESAALLNGFGPHTYVRSRGGLDDKRWRWRRLPHVCFQFLDNGRRKETVGLPNCKKLERRKRTNAQLRSGFRCCQGPREGRCQSQRQSHSARQTNRTLFRSAIAPESTQCATRWHTGPRTPKNLGMR